jgi:type I restriction-modification system DNA methylase subunit
MMSELEPVTQDTHLYDRLHDVLKKAEGFTKDKADEFKDEIELVEKLFQIHSIYDEETGEEFCDMFGEYMVLAEQAHMKRTGLFFTPMNVVKFMCQMLLVNKEDLKGEPKRILDPAGGTGRFMLGTAEVYAKVLGYYNFLFTNIDIDVRVYVYCTWNAIIHQIPSLNVWGNSLSEQYWEGVVVIPTSIDGPLRWHMLNTEQLDKILPKYVPPPPVTVTINGEAVDVQVLADALKL